MDGLLILILIAVVGYFILRGRRNSPRRNTKETFHYREELDRPGQRTHPRPPFDATSSEHRSKPTAAKVLLKGGLDSQRQSSKETFRCREEPHNLRQRIQTRLPFDARSSEPLSTPTLVEGPAYVVDGDTIVIRKTQIRLFGVDAPEMNHPYGVKAKWALVNLCKGQTVRAEIIAQDDHGRTVALCFLPDGRDLSAEMVKIGLAIDWPKFSGGKYRSLETADARKKLWLADARQKGRMHVWEQYDKRQNARKTQD